MFTIKTYNYLTGRPVSPRVCLPVELVSNGFFRVTEAFADITCDIPSEIQADNAAMYFPLNYWHTYDRAEDDILALSQLLPNVLFLISDGEGAFTALLGGQKEMFWAGEVPVAEWAEGFKWKSILK